MLVQNHGFASIGSLSESLGSQRFGTTYRYRDAKTGRLDGEAAARRPRRQRRQPRRPTSSRSTADELEQAIKEAKAAPADGGTTVIHVETDPLVYAPDSDAWWDVPVSSVSELDSTQTAYAEYTDHKSRQRPLLGPAQSASVYRKTGEEK